MAKPNLDDYNDVPTRKREFFAKFPDGSLQSECQFTEVDGRWVAIVKASAFRSPEDPRPGTGLAYEFIPGNTPYTKDSELQNAETAAWGRAIEATGASTSKKIASQEEVRNRTAQQPQQVRPDNDEGLAALRALCEEQHWQPATVAEVFQQHFHKHPRFAVNEELSNFISLVKAGALTIQASG